MYVHLCPVLLGQDMSSHVLSSVSLVDIQVDVEVHVPNKENKAH